MGRVTRIFGGKERFFMKILSDKIIILHSPHPPEACLERLREVVETSWRPWRSSKPVAGRVYRTSISIRKTIRYRNSFQTILTATVQPVGSGTEIKARVGLHPMVKAFMAVWFGFLGIIWAVLLVAILTGDFGPDNSDLPPLLALVFPLGMMAFGVLLLKFGKHLSRGEGDFLTDFVKELLEAREVLQAEPVE